ncbi:DUF2914 domain-containing protein [Geoalkalibacter sp.]|uniref:DUF2914 domain-containing protein n=1 Tax=Geoalkalibacter sp. TaxID=3041440 RepID=UPI00272DCA9E|nr:DUF2914 domain-containing protein [Geoalkalibacter sp.]
MKRSLGMLKKGLGLALGMFLLAGGVLAQSLEVVEAVITTDIIDRVPADAVESYSANVEQLHCFTRVLGATEETAIVHVWFHEGTEVTRMTLPVRSSNWRTWSTKTMSPETAGNWRVEVRDEQGEILKQLSFSLF